jgi:hypothetical protein
MVAARCNPRKSAVLYTLYGAAEKVHENGSRA